MDFYLFVILLFLLIASIIIVCLQIKLIHRNKNNDNSDINERLMSINQNLINLDKNFTDKLNMTSTANFNQAKQINDNLVTAVSVMDKNNSSKLSAISNNLSEQLMLSEKRFQSFSIDTNTRLESIRSTMDKHLTSLQKDNNRKLDEMKHIVDEKLQDTLNKRMNESFKLVNDRLEQVYKGLGEMQTLAQGVGDLKKVLTNVKSRGIVGEIQLGAILKEILSPEQYDVNIATVPNSKNVVEFAVKLPTEDGSFIYLPIDAKFPGDSYRNLQDAYENGDNEQINSCAKILVSTMKSEAKMIADKYIDAPHTTDFAIMFLPFEGLYAEAVNRGLVEILQNEYHINIAGPSTMAALLNSLQMGFKAFAIQKRSGEVWKVLSAVKTEFDKFEGVISATQNRLKQANDELDKLVGTRTRQIQRSLRGVSSLTPEESGKILELSDTNPESLFTIDK